MEVNVFFGLFFIFRTYLYFYSAMKVNPKIFGLNLFNLTFVYSVV